MCGAWKRGEVLVTLGSGKEAGEGLVPLHAYAVLGVLTFSLLGRVPVRG